MKTKIMSLLGLLVMGAMAVYGSQTDKPKMNGKLIVDTLAPEDACYTGKPYSKELGAYVFNYRNFDPQISRWTTTDPSGFPDGVNNQVYAPVPTKGFDSQGLHYDFDWSTFVDTQTTHTLTHGSPNYTITWEVCTVMTHDDQFTITLWRYLSGNIFSDRDFSYNCAGYTFANSQYWVNSGFHDILLGNGYQEITGNNKTGASVAYWANDAHVALVNTVDQNGNVTSVTGKLGQVLSPVTSAPDGQGGVGAPLSYWE